MKNVGQVLKLLLKYGIIKVIYLNEEKNNETKDGVSILALLFAFEFYKDI